MATSLKHVGNKIDKQSKKFQIYSGSINYWQKPEGENVLSSILGMEFAGAILLFGGIAAFVVLFAVWAMLGHKGVIQEIVFSIPMAVCLSAVVLGFFLSIRTSTLTGEKLENSYRKMVIGASVCGLLGGIVIPFGRYHFRKGIEDLQENRGQPA